MRDGLYWLIDYISANLFDELITEIEIYVNTYNPITSVINIITYGNKTMVVFVR